MPETIKTPVISRNGVDFTLTEQAFGKKSEKNAGKKFFAPVATAANWDDFLTWTGLDEVIGMTNRNLRRVFADIFLDPTCWNTDGSFNWEVWNAMAADFSAGQAKLSDIDDQIDELQSLQQSYTIDNPKFGEVDDAGKPTQESEDLMALVREGNKKIAALRAQKKAIEEKYAARAAVRKAKEEASATKTAA